MIDETLAGTAQRITEAGDDYAEAMNRYFKGFGSVSEMMLANRDFDEVLWASEDEIRLNITNNDCGGRDTFYLDQALITIAQARADVKTHTYVRAHAFALKAAHTLAQSR